MSAPVVASAAGERLRRVLSYTETRALKAVLEAMPTDEGVIVNAALSDQLGITRSVMVNALRVCEAAGVLQSRSMGMRGTHIRIHDRAALLQAVAS